MATAKVLLAPLTAPACAFKLSAAPATGMDTGPVHTPLAKVPLSGGRIGRSLSVVKRTSARVKLLIGAGRVVQVSGSPFVLLLEL